MYVLQNLQYFIIKQQNMILSMKISQMMINQTYLRMTEVDILDENLLPPEIHLINTKEVMKKRKVSALIRFHSFNAKNEPEEAAHRLLLLYLHWRKESGLFGPDGNYVCKLNDLSVKATVEHNRRFLEPYSAEEENAQDLLTSTNESDIFGIVDPHGEDGN